MAQSNTLMVLFSSKVRLDEGGGEKVKIGPAIRQRSACEVAQLARALRPITVRIQPEFQHLVVSADRVCAERFGARLVAVYLAGSVALCEAWPGASDLDCFAFLDGIPSPADKAWRRRAEKRLETEFPVASEVHLNVYPTERLRQESFWRFILRYNSLRINGSNLVAELGHQGFRNHGSKWSPIRSIWWKELSRTPLSRARN